MKNGRPNVYSFSVFSMDPLAAVRALMDPPTFQRLMDDLSINVQEVRRVAVLAMEYLKTSNSLEVTTACLLLAVLLCLLGMGR